MSLQPIADMLMLHRYDLSIALLNGSSPVFYCQPQHPVMVYPGQLLLAPDDEIYPQDKIGLIRQLDDNLVTACQIMRRFCLIVNLGSQAKQNFNPEIIHETMTSVMYRLLQTSFAGGVINKAVHLGLQAFSYHLFMQWQDIKLPYRHFPNNYQECIRSLKAIDTASPQLMLWLLMIGAVSLFNISDETWLGEYLREYIDICQIKTWKEMQDTLESYMWIVALDGQLGKQIYDELYLGVDEEKL